MKFSSYFPFPPTPEIEDHLKSLGHFVFLPNPGNVGDMLITLATIQVFEKLKLSYEFYDEHSDYGDNYTLVYGGGGGFVPDWGNLEWFCEKFTAPGIQRCVVLSQSMRNCAKLLNVMDERFTVFMRDRQSYDFARSLNTRAHFYLANDMAFCFNPQYFLKKIRRLNILPSWVSYRKAIMFRSILRRLHRPLEKTRAHIRRYRDFHQEWSTLQEQAVRSIQRLPGGQRIAWLMRSDKERATEVAPRTCDSFDVSLIKVDCCMIPVFDVAEVSRYLYYFLKIIDLADIVVTDRLHVSIGAAIMNRQVIMLDNTYGKLSGVWEQSMKHMPNIHFCPSDADFPGILQQVSCLR